MFARGKNRLTSGVFIPHRTAMYEFHLVELAQNYGAHRRISLSRVGALTVADGVAYFGSNDKRLYALRVSPPP